MPNNYFITGMPKCGKTTLITKVIEELKNKGLRVGGFYSPEHTEHGTRDAFFITDIETGETAVLAKAGAGGPKVGKYGVDLAAFESIALPILDNLEKYDVIVIDEIGRMELKSAKFQERLSNLLASRKQVIASLHRDFVESYGATGELITLTPENRETVLVYLLEKITQQKKTKKR